MTPVNIFKEGAHQGLVMGAYLTVMAVASIYTDKMPLLALFALLMLLCAPIVVYRYQRHTFVSEEGTTLFSSLWMQGIIIVICGALICSAVMYVMLQWVRPDFMASQVEQFIEIYRSQPETANSEIIEVMQKALDQGALPLPIDYAMTGFWLASFLGSVASLFTAAIAQRKISRSYQR